MDYRIVDDAGADVAQRRAPGELLVRARGADPRRGFFSELSEGRKPRPTKPGPAAGFIPAMSSAAMATSLFFVDRKKNIVRRSGENIAVVEVEGVLQLAR